MPIPGGRDILLGMPWFNTVNPVIDWETAPTFTLLVRWTTIPRGFTRIFVQFRSVLA